MKNFAHVLCDLIIESGKTKKKIAAEIGITYSQFCKYTKNTMPRVDSAIKIARYFNCRLDYLLGRSNIKNIK